MRGLKYNVALFMANVLFAVNYSVGLSLMQSFLLSYRQIYIIEILSLVVVAVPLALGRGRLFVVDFRSFLLVGLTALVSTLGWSYTTLWGLWLTSPIDVATIATVGPSLTLLFAHMLARRRFTELRLGGVALSLMGVAMLVVARGSILEVGSESFGSMLILVGVIAAAVNTLIIKGPVERYGVVSVMGWYGVVALVVNLPLFWGDFIAIELSSVSGSLIFELAYLVVIGSALPLFMLFEGTEYLTPLHTSLYRYVQPLVTTLVVVLRSQATLIWVNYVAMAVIVAGGVMMARGVDRGQ